MKKCRAILLILFFAAASCLILSCSVIVTVSFDTNGGSEISKQVLSSGSFAKRPPDPTKTGHTFGDWFKDSSLTDTFDFEKTKITKNTVIYADWSINSYSITFVTEGSPVETIIQPYGSPLEIFESYRSGYIFDGWYKDSTLATKFTLTHMPDCNLTLFAGWVQDKEYSAFTFEKNPYGYTLTAVKDIKLNLLVIPDTFSNQPVTRVGKAAFKQARRIVNIEIPDSVDFIDESAFEDCTDLVSVKLPRIDTLSARMFYNCAKLKTLSLPDTLKSIGKSAFYGCLELKNLKLPPLLEKIEERAFSESGITDVRIPEKVEILNSDLFYNCTKLASVQLESGLKQISSGVFEKCIILKEIVIPDGVKAIGSRAFAGCKQLDLVDLPLSLKQIGDYLFFDCEKLEDINLPAQLEFAGNYTFLNCINLKTVDLSAAITNLGIGFFDNCRALTAVDLPNGLKSIGEGAFLNCVWLKSIRLPAGIISIGYRAFYGCEIMSDVSFDDGVKDNLRQVGGQAFHRTKWLENHDEKDDVYTGRVLYRPGTDFTEFKNDTVAIAGNAFAGRKNLTVINFTSGIEIIGDSAFENCGLFSVSLPENLLVIGDNAFKNNDCLEEIEFSTGLKGIGSNAFSGCTLLKNINIPEETEFLGEGAFSGCTELENATLPDNEKIKSLPERLFYGCENLKSIIIPDNITTIGKMAFFDNKSLADADIGEGVKFIDISAFENCTKLESVVLPDSLTDIMAYAFKNAGLKKIIINSKINYIGEQAFISLYTQSSVYDTKPKVATPAATPYGITVVMYGSPTISQSFDAGVHIRIILPDTLYNQIQQEKFLMTAHENWKTYKPYIYSLSMIDGDFVITDKKLVAYLGDGSKADIPEGITQIAPYAFYDCAFLTGDITLPDTVTIVGAKAFFGCKNISALNLRSGLEQIGESAFMNMTGLVAITIPQTVSKIGASAFSGCGGLEFIYCQIRESQKPAGWNTGWLGDCPAKVIWE